MPEFDGFSVDFSSRILSRAYLNIIRIRIDGAVSEQELTQTQPHLRRIANTLIFHVVLNEERSVPDRRAAAFVASEAIALMADFIATVDVSSDSTGGSHGSIGSAERFARIESALLYLYARYDSCARGVLSYGSRPVEEFDDPVRLAADYCFRTLERLCRIDLYELDQVTISSEDLSLQYRSVSDLTAGTIARLYLALAQIVREFTNWLTDGAAGAKRSPPFRSTI